MAYREPAEDEEEKLDALEVEAFRQKLAREARRARVREYGVVFGLLGLFLGCFYLLIRHWSAEAAAIKQHDECHHGIRMHDDGNGRLVREDILICPDAAAP